MIIWVAFFKIKKLIKRWIWSLLHSKIFSEFFMQLSFWTPVLSFTISTKPWVLLNKAYWWNLALIDIFNEYWILCQIGQKETTYSVLSKDFCCTYHETLSKHWLFLHQCYPTHFIENKFVFLHRHLSSDPRALNA